MIRSRGFCLACVCLSACRVEPEAGEWPAADDAPSFDEPSRGGSGTRPPSGTGGASAAGAADPSGGSESGACHAQAVSLDELGSGSVVPGASVSLLATAASQKFLVSQSSAGACLWGVFVAGEPRDREPRGVLVISYGSDAEATLGCRAGSDAIPDAIAPGDVVRVAGRVSSFAPAACGDAPPELQIVSEASCPFEVVARAESPEPVPLPLDVADALADGADTELLRRFSGGLVRLENVSALPNETGDGSVRAYGVVAFAETRLELHADIEYGDLSAGGPKDPSKALELGYPARFRSITGLVYRDYCTVSLAPRYRCLDLDPPSTNCP